MIACTLKELPADLLHSGAKTACKVNPANAPRALLDTPVALHPDHLALLTNRYWGAGGVKLGVTFLDTSDTSLKSRILAHANAWGQWSNVSFSESGQGEVRISRTPGSGYWSYLGTDILSIPASQPTMNLDSFSMATPESEYHRVVRHEFGHVLAFPHEHARRDIVALLDPQKVYDYFERTQGWSRQMIDSQILTPLDESSLLDTPVDVISIMCYMFPGGVTLSGQAIPGGADIDPSDQAFAAKVYPRMAPPPPPPPPPPPGGTDWGARLTHRLTDLFTTMHSHGAARSDIMAALPASATAAVTAAFGG